MHRQRKALHLLYMMRTFDECVRFLLLINISFEHSIHAKCTYRDWEHGCAQHSVELIAVGMRCSAKTFIGL